MVMEAPSRVEIVALGASAAETISWRMRGELRVTVIVKAAFAFQPDAPMRVAEPEEIFRAEIHHGRSPSRSVRVTSDLAPYLPAADVVLTGHACAPEGETALGMSVRLAVFRDGPLLDKSINVLCTTDGDVDEPFESMPLVYERAYGGVGYGDNPFGIGAGQPAGGKTPNLIDPQSPERVACFGPIARGWPTRRRLLGKVDRRTLEGPLAEIPEGFQLAYYQAAPRDQQIPYLQGNEWIVLEGMHPVHTQICSCLPSAIGRARVFGFGGGPEGRSLTLVADTLRIDADSLTCSVVWRGSFAVPDPSVLERLVIHAGVDTAEKTVDWPPAPEEQARSAPAAPLPSVPPPAPAAAPSRPEPVSTPPPSEPTRTLPRPAAAAPAPRPRAKWDTTVELAPEHEGLLASTPAVPFRDGPVNLPASTPPPAPKRDFSATVHTAVLSDPSEGSPPTLPFRGHARPAQARSATESRPAPSQKRPFAATLPLDAERLPLPAALPFPATPPSPATPRFPATPPFPAAPPPPLEPDSPPTARFQEAPAPPKRPRSAEGIELVNDTPLALAVVPWKLRPSRDCLTVFAKATCDLVAGEPAALRPSAEPPSEERSLSGPRGPVCVYPSDFALFKVRADVVLVGHAHAPPGGAKSMEVRFRFGEGAGGFDRRLVVSGERRWEKAGAVSRISAPEPFLQMPLRRDMAFGGRGFEENPVGLGAANAMQKGPVLLPNLEDPAQRIKTPKQTPEPACFAPVSLAARGGKDMASRSLPEAFDWTRFQSAPRAQRLAFLQGDETFEIEGIHAKHPAFSGSLPAIRARCFAERKKGREEVSMLLDTAIFDLDEKTLTLVWRGLLPVADETSPDVTSLLLVTQPTSGSPVAD